MGFLEYYLLGQMKRGFGKIFKEHDARKSNFIKIGSIHEITELSGRLEEITKEVRKVSGERASQIKPPKGLLNKVFFYAGYFRGPKEVLAQVGDSETFLRSGYIRIDPEEDKYGRN